MLLVLTLSSVNTENVDFLPPPTPIIDVNSHLLPRVTSVMFSLPASRTILFTSAEQNKQRAFMDKANEK